jgi:hypothetical protein
MSFANTLGFPHPFRIPFQTLFVELTRRDQLYRLRGPTKFGCRRSPHRLADSRSTPLGDYPGCEQSRDCRLAAVTGNHYEGGHWLGSVAVYLVTNRSRFLPATSFCSRTQSKSRVSSREQHTNPAPTERNSKSDGPCCWSRHHRPVAGRENPKKFEKSRVWPPVRSARFVPLNTANPILLAQEPAWSVVLEELEAFLNGWGQTGRFLH